ncbi:LuxR C-terminal-related transcriptional regulator [Kutzneria sp. NPDC052558]|uniref:helix-turn-helix transcriptional regulator n=1 Tax=Kutzneria sp. NPDC052558 TaxID=3364121 RepID=UPI0037CADEE3
MGKWISIYISGGPVPRPRVVRVIALEGAVQDGNGRVSLRDFIGGDWTGSGPLAVVTGMSVAGVREAVEGAGRAAVERGAVVLRATAARMESALPFAAFVQLFSNAALPPEVVDAAHRLIESCLAAGTREGVVAEFRERRVVFGLCDLLLALAAERPVLIAIDEVQHIDAGSLRSLLCLVSRRPAPGLALVVGGLQPLESSPFPHWLSELMQGADSRAFTVPPMSEAEIEALAAGFGVPTTAERLAHWMCGSGGNPTLVRGLLEDHRHADHDDSVIEPGDYYRQAYLCCLHQDAQGVIGVIRAIAILGETTPARIAGLLDLGAGEVVSLMDRAAAAGLLHDGSFRHEVARAAVLSAIPADTKARLHREAANLLYHEGMPATAVAEHLIAAEHVDEPWTVEVLESAAVQLRLEGRAEGAVACLRLATTSANLGDVQRIRTRVRLAGAEWILDPTRAMRHLGALTEAGRRGELDIPHAAVVIRLLLWHGQVAEATDLLAQLGDGGSDERARAELYSISQLLRLVCPPLADAMGAVPAVIAPAGYDDVLVSVGLRHRANAALHKVITSGPTADVVASAEHVLRSARATYALMDYVVTALLTLVYAERADLAARWCEVFMAEDGPHGRSLGRAMVAMVRADVALSRGRLREAVDYAELALASLPEASWGVAIGLVRGILLTALAQAGRHEEATEHLKRPVPEMLFQTGFGLRYRIGRGHYYLAAGMPTAALDDFLACGRLARRWGIDQPAFLPWRTGAAAALLKIGGAARARELLEEQLTLVGSRGSRTAGITLRLLAATVPNQKRPKLLREAAETLQRSDDRYELAFALAELAQVHRALQDPDRAKLFARRAWRMAVECGAEPLAGPLAAAASAPREDVVRPTPEVPAPVSQTSGRKNPKAQNAIATLSEAERRVGALAAYGMTNREIAQKLFITASTVEQHLTRIYRKLSVDHRSSLPAYGWEWEAVETA